ASELVYGFSVRTNTDEAGRFDLPLFGGFWDLQMTAYRPGSPALLLPRIILRTVDGVDQTNSPFVARLGTSEVVVSVLDASGSNIALVEPVSAWTTVGNANYSSVASMDSSGRHILHLAEGTWRLHADLFPLDSSVAVGVPDRTVTVRGTNQVVSWVARNPTNHLRGKLVDNLGAPIADVGILAETVIV